jgi:ABC-type Co2+ transport system permease subunit
MLHRRGIRPDLRPAALGVAKALAIVVLLGVVAVLGQRFAGDWGRTPVGELTLLVVGGLPFAGLVFYFLRRRVA